MSVIKKIDCKDEQPKWHVWVEIQDGTEYCGSFQSKEEAIRAWAEGEKAYNHRKDDELTIMLPHVLGEEKQRRPYVPKNNKTKKQTEITDQWDMI